MISILMDLGLNEQEENTAASKMVRFAPDYTVHHHLTHILNILSLISGFCEEYIICRAFVIMMK